MPITKARKLPDGVIEKFCPGPKECTRYRLKNGWFIDHSPTVVHRHYTHEPYALWEPGGDPSGGAGYRGGETSLKRLIQKAKELKPWQD